MKRRPLIPTILGFLLLVGGGAIVNVAVAWGCASSSSRTSAESPVADVDRHFWDVQPEVVRLFDPRFHNLVLRGTREHGRGIDQRFVSATRIDRHCGEGLAFGRCVQVKAGWPVPVVCGEAEIVGDRWTTHELLATTALLRQKRTTDPPWRALPLRPIWPGFAINTVFYAAILWGLFAAPFALRRRRRIKRGLCPKCAYDLRGTPEGATACPECGAVGTPR